MEIQVEYTIVDERTLADKQLEIIEHYGMDKQLELSSEFIDEGVSRVKEYKVNREIDRISQVE